jgi:hypothetical protein
LPRVDEGLGDWPFKSKITIRNENNFIVNVTIKTVTAEQKPKNRFEVRRVIRAENPES